MPPAPRFIAAVFCGALMVGLGACTAPPAPPPPRAAPAVIPPDTRADAAQLLHRVIERVHEQGGVRTSVHGTLGMLGKLTSQGVIDYQREQADLMLHGRLALPNTGQDSHRVDVTVSDGIGYVRSPLMRSQSQKPWIRVNPEEPDPAAQLLAPALEQIKESTDPRFAFSGVEHATKIDSSAPERVNDQETTRYDLRIKTTRAAETTSLPRQRDRMRQAAEQGETELAYRIWLDESGLPVQFSATSNVDRAGQVSLTSTYHEWGVSADIQPPGAEAIGSLDATAPPQAEPPR